MYYIVFMGAYSWVRGEINQTPWTLLITVPHHIYNIHLIYHRSLEIQYTASILSYPCGSLQILKMWVLHWILVRHCESGDSSPLLATALSYLSSSPPHCTALWLTGRTYLPPHRIDIIFRRGFQQARSAERETELAISRWSQEVIIPTSNQDNYTLYTIRIRIPTSLIGTSRTDLKNKDQQPYVTSPIFPGNSVQIYHQSDSCQIGKIAI